MERVLVTTPGGRVPVIPYVFHEDVFFEYFEPYRHPGASFDDIWDGIGLETFGADFGIVRQLAPEYVWTIVDVDCGSEQWITPGVRYVNRYCYLIARKPNYRIDIDFRIRHSYSSLTPLGLRRQVTKLKRLLAEAPSLQVSPG
jgi:hypothetical protein